MLDNHGFDIWADGYDKSVKVSDESNEYPFAGYKALIGDIYGTIMEQAPKKVLDIGIGTGTLAAKLYEGGSHITGVDFSAKMLKISASKMADAILFEHDFTKGLPPAITNEKFDFIVSTYAFHHLTEDEKISFIIALLDNLTPEGVILIGDVSFLSQDDLEKCKAEADDEWDDDEHYFIYSELKDKLPSICTTKYYQYSHCAGVLEVRK